MDREIHLNAILALEKRIEGHEGHESVIIQLKRTRNSLLNVSTLLPPEILGDIFCWNATPDPDKDFGGLSRGSYNFLLVCHHWFEVASRTPDLWSFWGNSVRDWARRHTQCGTVPLDLVLEEDMSTSGDFDDKLRDALRDRAKRDLVRRVHLGGTTTVGLFNSVISSIVIEGEDIRQSSIESLIVGNVNRSSVDVSTFFSKYRLPKLRCLCLFGCTISSWGLLISQPTALTTLKLVMTELSPTPTLSQLLSVLSSSPLLRNLDLYYQTSLYVVGGDGSINQVQLQNLESLDLSGNFRCVFWLLNRLEFPVMINNLDISLHECSSLDLSRTLGPYLGDCIRRRGRFPGGGQGLTLNGRPGPLYLALGDIRNGDGLAELYVFAIVTATLGVQLEKRERDRLWFDIIAHIPWEQVTHLETGLPILGSEELCVKMCNLTHLHLGEVDLSTWFVVPDLCGPYTFKDLLRSLDYIGISQPTLSGGWSPLTNFLSRRADTRNRISWLGIEGHPHMGEGVVESIERAVEVFEDGDKDGD